MEVRNQDYQILMANYEASQNEKAHTSQQVLEEVLKQKECRVQELEDELKTFRAREDVSIGWNKEFQPGLEDLNVIHTFETVEFRTEPSIDSKLESESRECDPTDETDIEKSSNPTDSNENLGLTLKRFKVGFQLI